MLFPESGMFDGMVKTMRAGGTRRLTDCNDDPPLGHYYSMFG